MAGPKTSSDGFKGVFVGTIAVVLLFLLVIYHYFLGEYTVFIVKGDIQSQEDYVKQFTPDGHLQYRHTNIVNITGNTTAHPSGLTSPFISLSSSSTLSFTSVTAILSQSMPKSTSTSVQGVSAVSQALPSDIHLPHPVSTKVNCAKLFEGDETEKGRAYNAAPSSSFLSVEDLGIQTKDCNMFLQQREYIQRPVLQEEEDFPVAFSILMYHQPGMAERLLRAIYRPQNYYCIHVDSKAPFTIHHTMKALASCLHNVFVVPNPVEVYWGYYGVLEAELLCMKHLLKYKWKYFINLTGEEFPLKTNLEIVRILKILDGDNDISSQPSLPYTHRWLFRHNLNEQPDMSISKPPPSFSVFIHKGDAHVMLGRAFVEYIQNSSVALQLLDWLKDVFCPEEFFFSTLQYNPEFKVPGGSPDTDSVMARFHYEDLLYRVLRGSAVLVCYRLNVQKRMPALVTVYNLEGNRKVLSRHKVWDTAGLPCKGKWVRNICVYGIGDLPSLAKDTHALFLNKVKMDYEPFTYDCLEELYFNRTRANYGVTGHGQQVINVDEAHYKQARFH